MVQEGLGGRGGCYLKCPGSCRITLTARLAAVQVVAANMHNLVLAAMANRDPLLGWSQQVQG